MPVKTFVQRTTLREQIREQLNRSLSEEMESEIRKVGVWGLGGAGKSQLTRSYLRRYQADYNATFWIEASQTTSIDRDFLQIYLSFTNVLLQNNSPSPEEVLRAVHGWFIGKVGRWLFVFDGADQLEHESDPHFVNISRYIPGSPNVHIIITSRSSIAKTLSTFEGVNVGQLEKPQAVELFFKCSEIATTQQNVVNDVDLIVEELGYLALAISLAASYISQTPRLSSNLPTYLKDYRQRRQEILSEQPSKLIHQYSQSVMTVWEMSYSAVEIQLPEAGRFLTLLAFLNNEDIFLDLFGRDIDAAPPPQRSWSSVIWEQDKVSIHMIEKCLAILEKHSLLQRQENRTTYSMHKLVHAWGYDRLITVEQLKFSRSALDLVIEAIDRSQDTPEDKLRLVPHVIANFATLASASELSDPNAENTLDELGRIGLFMTDIGRLLEGYVIEKYVLKDKRRILGEENPSTISAMNNLAITLGDQGQLDEAAKMKMEVLEKRRRILGEEHPDTISAMNNLAQTLGDQGRRNEAAKMKIEVLEKSRRILGEEHPFTISAMNNLANTLRDQGWLDESAMILKEVLEKRKQILGGEHPDTIIAMNNLAATLGDQGQLDEAAKMKKEVLEKRRRILGEEHPDTISAMNNLAQTLGDQGRRNEAAKMKIEVLEKSRRILGEEHPFTISAMNNLAITLGDQGQLDEAAKMKKEVLEKSRRILGEEHPNTISAMNNLANTLIDQGRLDEATMISKEVLEKRKQILGEEHPDTIGAMNNLANALGDQGQLDVAAEMKKEVLEKMRRILSEEHPDTISAMNNLANTLGDQGQLDEAVKMLREVIEKRRRILGEEHPDTISAMNNLAATLADQGQLDEAISLLDITIHKMKRVHGDEHPRTKMAVRNLTLMTSRRVRQESIVIDGDKKKNRGRILYTRITRRFRKKAL